VELVPAGTAAAAAGIKPGDIILALDGHPLPDFDRLTAHIAQHKPGDKVKVDLLRGEDKLTLEATLGVRPNVQ
jgi:S1-C subfamily serine protease